jgi:hypothetical protein
LCYREAGKNKIPYVNSGLDLKKRIDSTGVRLRGLINLGAAPKNAN